VAAAWAAAAQRKKESNPEANSPSHTDYLKNNRASPLGIQLDKVFIEKELAFVFHNDFFLLIGTVYIVGLSIKIGTRVKVWNAVVD
jgi:hypothetical protein